MLTGLRLKNFQCHKNLELRLMPGLNCITGRSNLGKSAIFRALRWACEHKPIGEFATWDTDDTRVGLRTADATVIRFKNASGYGYKVQDQTFLACAATQPKEVRQALGISEINLQGQHDPPFLLSCTPGQFARELNAIVDLAAIDQSSALVKSRLSDTSSQVKVWQSVVAQQQATVDSRAWVVEAQEQLSAIMRESVWLDVQKLRLSELRKAEAQLVEVDTQRMKLLELRLELEDLYQAQFALSTQKALLRTRQELVRNYEAYTVQVTKLAPMIINGELLLQDLQKYAEAKEKLAVLKQGVVVLTTAKTTLSKMEDMAHQMTDWLERYAVYLANTSRLGLLRLLSSELTTSHLDLKAANSEVEELTKQASLLVCPTCGKSL